MNLILAWADYGHPSVNWTRQLGKIEVQAENFKKYNV